MTMSRSQRAGASWSLSWSLRAAAAAALTAVLAQLALPLPFTPVPVTLQVLGMLASAMVLPPAAAALSQVVYVALGAVGLPVFAGASGGWRVLVGPTGGYLLGFVAGATVTATMWHRAVTATPARAFAASVAGIAAVYAVGALQMAVVLGLSAAGAVTLGVVPFIGWDLLKAAVAAVVGPAVQRGLNRAGVLPSAHPATAPRA